MKFLSKLELLVAFLVVGFCYLTISGQGAGMSLNPHKKYAAELAQSSSACDDDRLKFSHVSQQL